MIQQLQISYGGIQKTGALEALILKECARLERFFERIVSCRVRLDQPHKRHGTPFMVHVEIGVPGETLVIEEPGQTLERAIHDAFRTATRRVHEHARRLQTPRA
jgi:ribosome-associated translation inhibitor RaiA